MPPRHRAFIDPSEEKTVFKTVVSLLFAALMMCQPFQGAAADAVTVWHGDRESPKIAITVDDCYDSRHILSVIELCEEHHIPVTFFPIGKALKFKDAALWQRALDAGCEIGNHSWGHTNLTRLSARDVRYQMLRTQQKLDEMLGYHYPMQVMRPLMGVTDQKVEAAVGSVDYLAVVRWDVSETDAKKAFKDVRNGSILLYHANPRDLRCLRTLIPRLIQKGFVCVTVSELLGFDPVAPENWIYDYEPAHADTGKYKPEME